MKTFQEAEAVAKENNDKIMKIIQQQCRGYHNLTERECIIQIYDLVSQIVHDL